MSFRETSVLHSVLPKLLAQENIRIQVGNFRTAFFVPKTRVLGLPQWSDRSKDQYDLLCGHEVGHALFTPPDDITRVNGLKKEISFDVYNVVEDIRIERKIQMKYPGLISSFRKGYAEFLTENFFGVSGKDLTKLGPVDRVNLFAKAGPSSGVILTPDEKKVFDAAYGAETFEDVVEVCRALQKLHSAWKKTGKQSLPPKPRPAPVEKEEKPAPSAEEDNDETPPPPPDVTEEDEDDSQDNTSKNLSPSEQETPENKEEDPSADGDKTESDDDDGDYDGEDDEEEDSQEESEEIPDVDPEDIKSETNSALQKTLAQEEASSTGPKIITAPPLSEQTQHIVDHAAVTSARKALPFSVPEFKNSAFYRTKVRQSLTLAAEFDRRKKAWETIREEESESGRLDPTKLAFYKVSEKIFQSKVELPVGQNHGMVMLIDYSGSMGRSIGAVLDQVSLMAMFCRRVSIPFAAYGFTNSLKEFNPGYLSDPYVTTPALSNTAVFEIINSKLNQAAFDLALAYLYSYGHNRGWAGSSHVEYMSSTPLLEAMILLDTVSANFKKTYSVEKLSIMIFSDGEGSTLSFHSPNFTANHTGAADSYRPLGSDPVDTQFTLGKSTFGCPGKYHCYNEWFSGLVQALKKNHDATLIFFFYASSDRDLYNHARRLELPNTLVPRTGKGLVNSLNSLCGANGFLSAKNLYGFDEYFIIQGRKISAGEEKSIEISDKAKDALADGNSRVLAKEFSKHCDSVALNRVLVDRIMALIA